MKRVRTFLAVELEPKLRRALRRLGRELDDTSADVRWVNPESCHLTIKFLGDVDFNTVGELAAAAGRAAETVAPFNFRLEGAGVFPRRGRPRVVWAGVTEPSGNLARLHAALEAELEPLGQARENRAFRPHVTIGRVRRDQAGELAGAVAGRDGETLGEQSADEIVLFMSELKRRGAEYTPLARIPLGEEAGPEPDHHDQQPEARP